jgi:hypothetical protein
VPAAKSLRELLTGGTFRPERHARLLESDSLPAEPPAGCDPDVWRSLRYLQLDYATAAGSRERRMLLEEFAAAARRLVAAPRPRLTMAQELALRIGLRPRLYDADEAVDRAIRRRWRSWIVEHRADFEAGRECPPPPPLEHDPSLRVLGRGSAAASPPGDPRSDLSRMRSRGSHDRVSETRVG